MSHPLYDDDEQVTCMCTKCGWLGTTTAPMFGCGGCKKYLARPMDLTDRKLKAAEAQVAQLQARVAELEAASPDDLRREGWMVAVHNDYRQAGEFRTFWLLTKDGRAVKGEGRCDSEALNQVRAEIKAQDERAHHQALKSRTDYFS